MASGVSSEAQELDELLRANASACDQRSNANMQACTPRPAWADRNRIL